jgi:hypothetical protein
VDIVFSDIEMPGSIDGFGLANWIREHRPGMDIILAALYRVRSTVQRSCASKVLCRSRTTHRSFTVTFAACWRRARRQTNPNLAHTTDT